MGNEIVEIDLLFVHETEKAFLVQEYEGGEKYWLPKSQVTCDHATLFVAGQVYEFSMPEWIADQHNLM